MEQGAGKYSSLSAVIPAFNEAARIEKAINETSAYLSRNFGEFEIIVVDDGSLDNTVELVRKISGNSGRIRLIQNVLNQGKGLSVKRGVLVSRFDYVLFMDADLSTPVDELGRVMAAFSEGYGAVIGSRRMGGSQIEVYQPLLRRVSGALFHQLRKLLLLRDISDTQCGFKCFTREAAGKIFSAQKIKGFTFDVEILLLAKKFGYNIKEVPVKWIDNPKSKLFFFRHFGNILADLAKITINNLFNRYSK